MKLCRVRGRPSWKVLDKTSRSQAAAMTITPGHSEGGPENRHPKSDQWMWVIAGQGLAVIEGRKKRLAVGTLLLIEKGERHQIFCVGRTPLQTINVYAPPAY